MTGRSYLHYCSVAHALDLIGERWALLVVRELILGPKRFGAVGGPYAMGGSIRGGRYFSHGQSRAFTPNWRPQVEPLAETNRAHAAGGCVLITIPASGSLTGNAPKR